MKQQTKMTKRGNNQIITSVPFLLFFVHFCPFFLWAWYKSTIKQKRSSSFCLRECNLFGISWMTRVWNRNLFPFTKKETWCISLSCRDGVNIPVPSISVRNVMELVSFSLEDDDVRMLIAVTVVAVLYGTLLCGVAHSVNLLWVEKSFSYI